MIPFDERWIHRVKGRHGLNHEWERSVTYRIATNANMAATRHLANRFVDRLPDKTQVKFIQRLRDGENFFDTFHEVVVGEMLARCGPLPEYETELAANKTPDWYLPPRSGQIACAVEVVSRNTQDGQGNRRLSELVFRLGEIPVGVVLNMESASEHVVLSSGKSKEIASNVWKWLKSASAVPNSRLQMGEFSFTVLPMQSGDDHVCIIQTFDAIRIDPRSLGSLVAKKAHKYAGVCQDSGTALVIAVIADVATGSSIRSAESMLLGSVKGSVVLDKSTGQILSKRSYRAHDGVFEHYPRLSGVAWVEENQPSTWTSTLFMNPACTLRLPDQVLRGLQSTMAIACAT